MNKHTPGPWHVHTRDRANIYAFAHDGPNAGAPGLVAHVFDSDFPNGYQSNAILIAAAPEMLELLRQIQPYIPKRAHRWTRGTDLRDSHTGYGEREYFHDLIRALLARLDGQE